MLVPVSLRNKSISVKEKTKCRYELQDYEGITERRHKHVLIDNRKRTNALNIWSVAKWWKRGNATNSCQNLDLRSRTWGKASATVSSNFRIPSAVFRSLSTMDEKKRNVIKMCFATIDKRSGFLIITITEFDNNRKLVDTRLQTFVLYFRLRVTTNQCTLHWYVTTSSVCFFFLGEGEGVE